MQKRIYEIQKRHAQYYLVALINVGEDYENSTQNSTLTAVDCFDKDWDQIQCGQKWAAQNAGQDNEAARMTSFYADAASGLRDIRQSPQDQILWSKAALDASRQLNNLRHQCTHLGNLGAAYHALRRHDQSVHYTKLALDLSIQIDDFPTQCSLLSQLGSAYAEMGDYHQAEKCYDQALSITTEHHIRRETGAIMSNIQEPS
jgi:tetratricopeptide (TPR) repeat protein